MMAWATNAFSNNSSSILQQKFQRAIDDQLSSPASPIQLLLAFSLGGFLRGMTVATLTFVAASILIGVPVEHVLVLIPALFLVGFFFAQLGVLIGVRAEQFDDVSFAQTFVLQPLIFLGGVFYSASLLPEPFQTITHFNPVYYMIGLVRYGFLGYSETNIALSLVVPDGGDGGAVRVQPAAVQPRLEAARLGQGPLGERADEPVHARARVLGALAGGAAALAQEPLDLLERVAAVELAGHHDQPRQQRARRPRAAGARGRPRRGSRRRARRARRGTTTSRARRAGRSTGERALGLVAGEAVHERGEREHVAQLGLGVHLAHLDGAEPRVRAHVPPELRAVLHPGGAQRRLERVLVVGEVAERARDAAAGVGAHERGAGAGQAGVDAEPERRVGGQPGQQRQVGAQAVGRRGSRSRGRASRRARAARTRACARSRPRSSAPTRR